jgi:hypothetical protein
VEGSTACAVRGGDRGEHKLREVEIADWRWREGRRFGRDFLEIADWRRIEVLTTGGEASPGKECHGWEEARAQEK